MRHACNNATWIITWNRLYVVKKWQHVIVKWEAVRSTTFSDHRSDTSFFHQGSYVFLSRMRSRTILGGSGSGSGEVRIKSESEGIKSGEVRIRGKVPNQGKTFRRLRLPVNCAGSGVSTPAPAPTPMYLILKTKPKRQCIFYPKFQLNIMWCVHFFFAFAFFILLFFCL